MNINGSFERRMLSSSSNKLWRMKEGNRIGSKCPQQRRLMTIRMLLTACGNVLFRVVSSVHDGFHRREIHRGSSGILKERRWLLDLIFSIYYLPLTFPLHQWQSPGEGEESRIWKSLELATGKWKFSERQHAVFLRSAQMVSIPDMIGYDRIKIKVYGVLPGCESDPTGRWKQYQGEQISDIRKLRTGNWEWGTGSEPKHNGLTVVVFHPQPKDQKAKRPKDQKSPSDVGH